MEQTNGTVADKEMGLKVLGVGYVGGLRKEKQCHSIVGKFSKEGKLIVSGRGEIMEEEKLRYNLQDENLTLDSCMIVHQC